MLCRIGRKNWGHVGKADLNKTMTTAHKNATHIGPAAFLRQREECNVW